MAIETNLDGIIEVRLTKEKNPAAFEKKVQELINDCGVGRADAEQMVSEMIFELELVYHEGQGLFAVESEVLECFGFDIHSPYNGEKIM